VFKNSPHHTAFAAIHTSILALAAILWAFRGSFIHKLGMGSATYQALACIFEEVKSIGFQQ
jgi:hypothetical protein